MACWTICRVLRHQWPNEKDVRLRSSHQSPLRDLMRMEGGTPQYTLWKMSHHLRVTPGQLRQRWRILACLDLAKRIGFTGCGYSIELINSNNYHTYAMLRSNMCETWTCHVEGEGVKFQEKLNQLAASTHRLHDARKLCRSLSWNSFQPNDFPCWAKWRIRNCLQAGHTLLLDMGYNRTWCILMRCLCYWCQVCRLDCLPARYC